MEVDKSEHVEADRAKSVSPNPVAPTSAAPSSEGSQHHVSSFLKFSIQNILQQAAASSGASAAAAAVASAVSASAAAARRSNEFIHPDMAAAMSDLDVKRAMGALPLW